MHHTLQIFHRWFWISFTLAFVFGVLLFIATRRRGAWVRYTASETEFWIRLGLPRKLVDAIRHWEESRSAVCWLRFLVIAYIVLMLFHGAAYLYFKHVVRSNPTLTITAPSEGTTRKEEAK
jgi:Na+/H+ antiporter NhaC